jgi:hypothetical protein
MKFNDEEVVGLREIKTIARPSAGYGDVTYEFSDRDLTVNFKYSDQHTASRKSGAVKFEFVVALSIESETNNKIGLPDESGVLFGFDTNLRKGFSGYQIWFSNNDLITVVCQRVFIGNEVF